MRVISGSAKGRKLKMVPGDTTRPVTDRVKESLFNILGDWVTGTRWLDIFAGTGQVGIEALSRGADEVIFVDNARLAIKTIRQNLQHTYLSKDAKVIFQDAFSFLQRANQGPFDVIYVAPPQYRDLWTAVLLKIDQEPDLYMKSEAIVIVQIDPKEFAELELQRLSLYDQRRYGRTMLCFYEVGEVNDT